MSNALAKSEINKAFLKHLKEDFEQFGLGVIQSVRVSDPDKYLAIVAKLLPTEIALTVTISPLDYLTHDQLEQLYTRLAGCEKFLEANSDEIDAIALPQELLGVHKDIIA